ncbi:hypothetical protein NG798_08800 [Ancylothrix sp. C2]|uniref:hypothetical protein n=1 Tax=Ancylothrix sp. D3o TaxID=2953691 RepID=UPI0021BB061E|nr:hypothetical protein [Ancylothrix sp. D3o]MCT7949883.1 hypothetical protein [Ancylothrix sp. D3o]
MKAISASITICPKRGKRCYLAYDGKSVRLLNAIMGMKKGKNIEYKKALAES